MFKFKSVWVACIAHDDKLIPYAYVGNTHTYSNAAYTSRTPDQSLFNLKLVSC